MILEKINVIDIIKLWDLEGKYYKFGYKLTRSNKRAILFMDKLWVNYNIPEIIKKNEVENYINHLAVNNEMQTICHGIPQK